MPTNQKMKAQRRMMSDTMSPSFLNEKTAPSIHQAVMDLMELWKVKARLAGSQRVFQADVDLRHAILDALWPVALGTHPGTVKAQTEALKESSEIPETNSDVVEFSSFHVPETFEAMAGIADSVESILSSPFPAIHHWILRQFPKLRTVFQVKERLITSSLEAALNRAQEGSKIQSAADLILSRALKTGTADVASPVVRDELFGFLVAGHDTTATTLAWGVKYLSDHPAVLDKLRRRMRKAWPYTKVPTAEDLVRTSVPYLEAVVEEIARCSGTQSAISRRTTKDVNIMNVLIPKGTDVFFMTNGPDFREVKIPVFPAYKGPSEDPRPGFWPDYTLGYFCPERWINFEGDGEQFVQDAGPSYPFGAGFRGCFGKRLARLQLRIAVALLVSSFELEDVPQALSSYAATDKLNHHPQQCYVRLREIK
ncbi:hypothetical protein PRZ48_009120 [Zasmidium cellare]|uniref:Cytochrome P450 n=1 Tax=Zasmidium cellare TaxID=395010 RepID=A0ABR0EIA3_ZASCE|nr:hypothetical protein PRZ48_009120 [Zasmidium cellare]